MLIKTDSVRTQTEREFPFDLNMSERKMLGITLGVGSVFNITSQQEDRRSMETLIKWIAIWSYRALDMLDDRFTHDGHWLLFNGDPIMAKEMRDIIEERKTRPYRSNQRPAQYQK